MKPILASTLFLISTSAFANCENLKSCVEEASVISGVSYIGAVDLNQKNFISDSFSLNKENVDKSISVLLNQHGYTRININEKTKLIIPARDVRYSNIESINWTGDTNDIPDLSDYFLLTYPLKNQESLPYMTRALRPFLSRYGRIIEQVTSSTIIVQDTGLNLRKIAGLIKKIDQPFDEQKVRDIEKKMKHTNRENKSNKEGHGRKRNP